MKNKEVFPNLPPKVISVYNPSTWFNKINGVENLKIDSQKLNGFAYNKYDPEMTGAVNDVTEYTVNFDFNGKSVSCFFAYVSKYFSKYGTSSTNMVGGIDIDGVGVLDICVGDKKRPEFVMNETFKTLNIKLSEIDERTEFLEKNIKIYNEKIK